MKRKNLGTQGSGAKDSGPKVDRRKFLTGVAVAGAAGTRWRDAGHGLLIPIVLLAALAFRRGWTVG